MLRIAEFALGSGPAALIEVPSPFGLRCELAWGRPGAALMPTCWLLLADAVLLLHVLFVAFVVLGLLLVLIGGWRHWRWVRNPWFRVTHLAAILFVVGQTWLDMTCPLTTLELAFRAHAGTQIYVGSFIGHWLQVLLYYQAPNWVFAVVYSVLALAVVWSWIKVPPAPFTGSRSSHH